MTPPIAQGKAMTHEEAKSEARRRWGPTGDALHEPDKPITHYVGYWHRPPHSHLHFVLVGCGHSWEGAFQAADSLSNPHR